MQAETTITSGSATRRSMLCSRVDAATKRRCRQADVKRTLAVQPIRGLHEERVARVGVEQLIEVSRNSAGTHGRLEVVASLIPHQEQGRARSILPSHHKIRVEKLDVEITRPRSGERLEAIVVAGSAGRGGQLAHVGP